MLREKKGAKKGGKSEVGLSASSVQEKGGSILGDFRAKKMAKKYQHFVLKCYSSTLVVAKHAQESF
jgi:hypothetical protein